MSKEYFKKTLAGIFAVAIVASSIPLAPYTKVLDSISITASAISSEVDSWSGLQTAIDEAEAGVETPIALAQNITASDGDTFIAIPADKVITLDLNGYTLDRGLSTAAEDGYVIRNNGTLTICDESEKQTGKITGGNCSNNGGGIYNYTNSTLTINGGSITGNTSSYGGGIYNIEGTITINGGSITGNTSSCGGGIYNNIGTLTINGGSITGNTSSYGGGIFSNGSKSTLTISGGSITGNTTSYSAGGGIYNKEGTLTISGGSITRNTSSSAGGGIYNNEGTLTISGGSITGNTSSSDGGGINNYGGTLTINGGNISDNTAQSGGGICNIQESTLTITGGNITGNSSATYGGGIITYTPANITVGGSAIINGNRSTHSSDHIEESNIHLNVTSNGAQAKLQISETTPLTNSASIGITVWLASGWGENTDVSKYIDGLTADNAKHFFATNCGSANRGAIYYITAEDGKFVTTTEKPAAGNTIPNSTLTWEIDENGVLTISGDDEAFPECWVNDAAVEWCDKKADVKEVVFVTPKLKKLGSAAFYEFPMAKITLPSTLTEIGYAAFKYCAKLESLDIPNGVKEIPDSLLQMAQDENNGWASITSLTSISMAPDVTKIGGWAFANCTSVISFDGLADSLKGLTSLGEGALMGLSIDDTLIYIPKTLNQTSIGRFTFNGANLGTDLEIPSFITELGENAFGWANLENVIIPASVSKIDKNAFVGWGNLKTITLLGAADSVTIDDEAFSGNNVDWNTMTFYVPVSQVDAYKSMKALEGSKVIGQAAATFDLGGKGDNFTLNTDDEVKITEPTAPTADGVVFAGWYTDKTYSTEFNFNDVLTDDEVTIYAKWKNEYTVTFDANSVTTKETLDSKTYLDGDALGELPELTADGYVFKGWKDSNGASVTDATKVTDNMTLYAQWKDIWTVTFDMNGVTPKEALSPKPFEDGTMISSGQYPTPKADGYVFDGWYADAACSSPALSGYFHADQTVYAKWIKVYDVTFDCGEYGSISGDSTLSTNKQGVLSYVPTPTPKDGYSFAGWYTDEKFTNKFDETAVITKDTTLYAKYQAYVDFYVDGYCESIDSRLIELGSTTEDPGTPTVLDEYSSFVTFAGWYTDEDYKTKFDFSKPITASTTVYAKWNVEMTVNFDTGETGVEIPSVKVMAGDKIKMPDVDDYEIIDIFTDKTMFNNFYIDEPIPVRKSGVFTLYVELLQIRGDCGENLRWEFNLEDYIMTVSGTGTKIMDCTQAQAWNPEGLRYICVIFDTPNLKEIGSSAFRDADIPFLNIPSTVTKINDYAFSNCRHLLSVTFESSEPPVLGNSVFGSDSQLCAMYVPADAVDTYKAAYPEYKDIIQANPVGMLGYSVSYDGDVTINFHMTIQNAADSDFLYLVDHNDYLMVADAKTGSKADEYIFSISLPAKNMYDPITVQYGTDTQPIGGQYTFKLEDYMDAFKDTAPDTKTKAFVDSFLEYGKQAAAYFGNTNAPASEKTYDYDSIISALKADGYNKLPDMGSNYVGATMLLKSIPILRLYYKDEVTGLDLGEYGYWDFNDNNLDLTFIQKKIIVTDFDTTFNGYSVYHYFYKAFESGDEKLMKLCAALYELGHAANDI